MIQNITMSCVLLHDDGDEALQEVKRIRFTGDFNEGHFDVLIPVSYTHLDVYKRQSHIR